jgi:carboxylate-amine ligase
MTDVLSFGIEEEFVLVETDSRTTAPRSAAVVEQLEGRLCGRAKHEFFATQIELNTRVKTAPSALRAELLAGRRVTVEAAGRVGCGLAASASGILSPNPLPVTRTPRYLRMAQRFSGVVDAIQSETNACHIHLGVLTRGEALALGNKIRPWLPALQALATNSPFAAGQDRGCASWRYFECRLWPTVGPAPELDEKTYEDLADRLTGSGTILDRKMIYWYSRPSEHLPTLEIRVADVNPDVNVPVLLAVLVRGLAMTLLASLDHDRPCPELRDDALLVAHQNAARDGLAGLGPNPLTGEVAPLDECLEALFAYSRTGLMAARDLDVAEELLAAVRAQGSGAERQRADFAVRGSLFDVVDSLIARTAT